MAKKEKTGKRTARMAQIREVYRLTKRVDPKIGWILLATFLGTAALFVVLGVVLGPLWAWLPPGLAIALLVTGIVFGRRAERSAFAQIEGQPGAALAVLKSIKRGWTVTEAVAATPSMRITDTAIVHRAVGRPGVVLIAEGNLGRVGSLLAGEKRKMARMLGTEVPVYDAVIGNGANQVPLRNLRSYLVKLPRNLDKAKIREINSRLRALPGIQQQMPRGPMPKNVRMPKGGGSPKVR
ncbi:MAG: DUF4191 domain-containing protein [Sporichthyaceae bacterium]|nr:DUF4191 domain-containing protein [Sporichthyaceae bacterium]